MAGDWIKWVKGLIRKPEIIRAAGVLGRSRHDIAARWMDLMEWADENVSEANRVPNSEDALVKTLTPAIIDDLVGLPEFARAMTSNGWLAVRSADMVFVNYFRHNAVSAKERALSANRSADKRRRDAERDVRHGVTVTREEKRREEKRREEKKEENPSVISPSETLNPQQGNYTHPVNRYTADRKSRSIDAPPGFLAAIAEYPASRSRSRAEAFQAWGDTQAEAIASDVIRGILAWKESDEWKRGVIPKFEKFIKERHWEVEPPPSAAKSVHQGGGMAW